MNLRTLTTPIALIAPCLALQAGIDTHVDPLSCACAIGSTSWELRLKQEGGAVLVLSRGERTLTIRGQSGSGMEALSGVLDFGSGRIPMDLGKEGSAQELATHVQLFAMEDKGGTIDAFKALGKLLLESLAVEAQEAAGTVEDRARAKALLEYWNTAPACGVGSLDAIRTLFRDYRAAFSASEQAKVTHYLKTFRGLPAGGRLSFKQLEGFSDVMPAFVSYGLGTAGTPEAAPAGTLESKAAVASEPARTAAGAPASAAPASAAAGVDPTAQENLVPKANAKPRAGAGTPAKTQPSPGRNRASSVPAQGGRRPLLAFQGQ